MSDNAQPIPELTDVHKKWVSNLQKDNPNLPVGYARGIVELYLSQPELFTKENVDRWAAEKPPLMHTTNGEVRVLTPEEAKEFEAKLPPAEAETVSNMDSDADNDNAKHFEVTDRTNGDAVEL